MGQGLVPAPWTSLLQWSPCHLQLREHLAKGQRMLAGEGMSQVVRSLQELLGPGALLQWGPAFSGGTF